MSDLSATNCSGGCSTFMDHNDNCGCSSLIWIIILLSLCGNGCGCGEGHFGRHCDDPYRSVVLSGFGYDLALQFRPARDRKSGDYVCLLHGRAVQQGRSLHSALLPVRLVRHLVCRAGRLDTGADPLGAVLPFRKMGGSRVPESRTGRVI